MNLMLWSVSAYLIVGLLFAILMTLFASGQGESIGVVGFLREIVIWPARAWMMVRR